MQIQPSLQEKTVLSSTDTGEEKHPQIQSIVITWEELYKQLCLILDTVDFQEYYRLLHLNKLNFIKKKKAKTELKALVLSLWYLCLHNTLEKESSAFFKKSVKELLQSKRIDENVLAVYQQYWEELQSKQEQDFSPPAELMRMRLCLDKRNIHTMTIALYIRSIYKYTKEYLFDMSVVEE